MANSFPNGPVTHWPSLSDDAADAVRRMTSHDGGKAALYLCYSDTPRIRVCGILVTQKASINEMIAYCPLAPDTPAAGAKLTKELARRMKTALRIAQYPHTASYAVDAIGLTSIGTDLRAVPHWIYGLSCVPLNGPWDGKFVHPQPFCPDLFLAMARQEKAGDWLRRQGQAG